MDPAMTMALMPTLIDPEVAVRARVEISGDEFKMANTGTILAHSGFVVEGDGVYTMETSNTILTLVLSSESTAESEA